MSLFGAAAGAIAGGVSSIIGGAFGKLLDNAKKIYFGR